MKNCTNRSFKSLFKIKLLGVSLALSLLVASAPATFASGTLQDAKITLTAKNKTLKDVFGEIEKKSNYVVVFNNNAINPNQKVSVDFQNESINDVLKKLLSGTSASYEIKGRQIVIFSTNEAGSTSERASQQGQITGKVVDENKMPLIGVSIQVKGTTIGTATDADGNFTLNTSAAQPVLVFSYVGFEKKEVSVTSKKSLSVTLNSESKSINEVVVVGYGAVRKRDVTGAVSAVKEKDFNVGVIAAPTQMIQGRVAGVNVTSNGGEPGAGTTVRVRGSNSIRSGQDPLYVVDGVPLDITDSQPQGASVTGVGESAKKNPLNFLNPDDIESIDVLKDASATAIYGSRGANGVIIVTTKKGKEGKGKVSYSGYYGVSYLPSKYPVLSADEYRKFITDNSLTLNDGKANTDWQDEIFRTAQVQSHSLSYGGGNGGTSYRASLSYLDQDGIIKKTGIEKYTGRFNISQRTFNDKLLIEGSLTASRNNDQRAPIGESGGVEGDMLLSALKMNPTFPVYNADGTYNQPSKDVRNPLAMINLTNDRTQTDRILANVAGTYTILNGLTYKMNVALDNAKATRKVTQQKELTYLINKGTADINNVEKSNYLIENYFNYNFNFTEKHSFNVMAGHSYQRFKYYGYGISVDGFSVDGIDYLNELTFGNYTQAKTYSDITINELQSFFGRVNYNLDNKYLFTVNFRTDGSTKFGENNKYGYFPSAAFAWKMSEEGFIKDIKQITNLKMRLSWGITGNQEIPNKISQILLGTSSGSSAILNGGSTITPGVTLTRTPNPDIKWEKTEQLDWGLDFALFNGRISGSVDIFNKTTKDVLLEVYSIAPAPTTKVWTNVEDMKIVNKGIEVALNGVIIDKNGLNWSAGVNFSKIDNEVKNLPMSFITTGSPSGPGITGFSSQIIKSGYPIGTFWGYKFLGFDAAGKSLYETDANGKPTEQCIGNAQPDFSMNFNTSVSWKGFDASIFFTGVFGNDIYNNLANIMDQRSLVTSGWNTTVDATKSAEAFNNKLDYSSRFIENGSYLRLSSATLGYSFNLKNNKYFSKLRVYATGNNLFVITNYSGYDPEVNSARVSNGVPALGIGWTNYPMARTISLGLTAEF